MPAPGLAFPNSRSTRPRSSRSPCTHGERHARGPCGRTRRRWWRRSSTRVRTPQRSCCLALVRGRGKAGASAPVCAEPVFRDFPELSTVGHPGRRRVQSRRPRRAFNGTELSAPADPRQSCAPELAAPGTPHALRRVTRQRATRPGSDQTDQIGSLGARPERSVFPHAVIGRSRCALTHHAEISRRVP
jgi:hypothetical protein